jgi:hypothetical protein
MSAEPNFDYRSPVGRRDEDSDLPPAAQRDTAHRRAKLVRHAHELARSGKYEDAASVIEAIRSHADFHPSSHEASAFRGALNALCKLAKVRNNSRTDKLA